MKRLPALLLTLSLLAACGEVAATPTATPTPAPTPSAQETAPAPVPMPAFTTTDLEGNEVTEAIFGEKELTVVNIWGTFCTPCIDEMPELAEWYDEMPDELGLLGIVCDLSADSDQATHDLAVDIVTQAGVDYPCLLVCDDLSGLLSAVVGVPTTFCVDKEGNIVGRAILGAYVDEYKAMAEALLNEGE